MIASSSATGRRDSRSSSVSNRKPVRARLMFFIRRQYYRLIDG